MRLVEMQPDKYSDMPKSAKPRYLSCQVLPSGVYAVLHDSEKNPIGTQKVECVEVRPGVNSVSLGFTNRPGELTVIRVGDDLSFQMGGNGIEAVTILGANKYLSRGERWALEALM